MKKRDTYNQGKEIFFTKLSWFVIIASSVCCVSIVAIALVDPEYRGAACGAALVALMILMRGLFVALRLLILAAACSAAFTRLIHYTTADKHYVFNSLAFEPQFCNWFKLFTMYFCREFPNHVLLYDSMILRYTFLGIDLIDDHKEVVDIVTKFAGDDNEIIKFSPPMVLTARYTAADVHAMGHDIFKDVFEPKLNGSFVEPRDYLFIYDQGTFKVGRPVTKALEA